MNGSRERSEAACEISAKSIVSCTEAAPSIPQPGRTAGHDVAVVAENGERVRGDRARGDVGKTVGNSSPANLNMFGIINSRRRT